MIQQVNLYQDSLKQSKTRPVIVYYIYGLTALFSLLISFSFFLNSNIKNTKADIISIKHKLRNAKTHVQLLQVQYPRQQINKLLTQKITQSQEMRTSLANIISLLTDKESDQTQGFSRYFSAFSRQNIPELWLNNIIINTQEKSLHLFGSTYYPEKVPMLLQKLHREPIFQGKIFIKLLMNKAEKSDKQIDFVISTTLKIPDI
ncbi:MAG: hypothetical protein KAT04_07805 [Methylococcales bacterium]|nr:hypothetical protein [Methylococcales bacterium]